MSGEAWATIAATPWPPAVTETPGTGHEVASNPWAFPVQNRVPSSDAYWNHRQRRYHVVQQVRG